MPATADPARAWYMRHRPEGYTFALVVAEPVNRDEARRFTKGVLRGHGAKVESLVLIRGGWERDYNHTPRLPPEFRADWWTVYRPA